MQSDAWPLIPVIFCQCSPSLLVSLKDCPVVLTAPNPIRSGLSRLHNALWQPPPPRRPCPALVGFLGSPQIQRAVADDDWVSHCIHASAKSSRAIPHACRVRTTPASIPDFPPRPARSRRRSGDRGCFSAHIRNNVSGREKRETQARSCSTGSSATTAGCPCSHAVLVTVSDTSRSSLEIQAQLAFRRHRLIPPPSRNAVFHLVLCRVHGELLEDRCIHLRLLRGRDKFLHVRLRFADRIGHGQHPLVVLARPFVQAEFLL